MSTPDETAITLETECIDARIHESEGQTASGGHLVEVTIIRAGTSSNGNHYSEEVLRKAAPLFEGTRAFADHQSARDAGLPRSVRDLVGHYRNPRFEPGAHGSGKHGRIRADFHLLPGQDWLWGIIREAQFHPDLCGLSIDAKGEVKVDEIDGRRVLLVEAIRKVNSIDFVSRPAAGGSLDRILASHGRADDEMAVDRRPIQETGKTNSESTREEFRGATDVGISDERPQMESDGDTVGQFDAEARKRFATVVRHNPDGTTEYKFPIPPRGSPGAEVHARAALARLDQSDLSNEEKAMVRQKAEAVLGHNKPGVRNATGQQQDREVTEESLGSDRMGRIPNGNSPYHSKEIGLMPEALAADRTENRKDEIDGAQSGFGAMENEQRRGIAFGQGSLIEAKAHPPAIGESMRVNGGPNQGDPGYAVSGAGAVDIAGELKNLRSERDAAAGELTRIREALAMPPSPTAGSELSAVQLLEQIRRDRDLEKSARVLDVGLRESKLPDAIQNRLRRRYDGHIFTEGQLADDIEDEREVLGTLSRSGQVSGHGFEKPLQLGMSEYEQLQAGFDKMFDVCESEQARSVPAFGGIRDAFRTATGVDVANTGGVDRPLQESYQAGLRNYVAAKMASGRLTEAEYLLREADVTTSTFSYLLGTSMNKRLLKDYQAWPSEWQKFTNVVAVKDFKLQDRIRLGAFGSLSTVSEDAAYTTLTLADTHATYTPTKRGNLVQISRETIINDDLYAIKQIPQKLAISAAFTLAEFIYELLDPAGGNIYDGHKLFDSVNHLNTGVTAGNLGTANSGTAFSSAAMQTAVIAMRKQTNAASKPIGLKPRFVIVPPDLEFTAMTVLKSAGLPGGSNNDINPMLGYAEPIVAPQLNSFTTLGATTTFAAVVADPRVIDTIEIGFIGGQVNPVLFIQDQPLYGLNFTQDVISYKVRHEYGGAVVDYRGFYLINN